MAATRAPRATRSDRFTWTIIESPMGPLLAVTSPIGLCELEFDGVRRARTLAARLAERFPDLGGAPDSLVEASARGGPLAPARAWLRRYFAGDLPRGDELALDLRGQRVRAPRVGARLLTIPAGETRAYGELATAIGSPGAARAVGLANSRNPVAIVVPCHRVIGADGSLTGYAGGMARKRRCSSTSAPRVAEARGEARQLSLLPRVSRAPADAVAAVVHPDPYPYYAALVADRPFAHDGALGMWVAASAARCRRCLPTSRAACDRRRSASRRRSRRRLRARSSAASRA